MRYVYTWIGKRTWPTISIVASKLKNFARIKFTGSHVAYTTGGSISEDVHNVDTVTIQITVYKLDLQNSTIFIILLDTRGHSVIAGLWMVIFEQSCNSWQDQQACRAMCDSWAVIQCCSIYTTLICCFWKRCIRQESDAFWVALLINLPPTGYMFKNVDELGCTKLSEGGRKNPACIPVEKLTGRTPLIY